MAKNNQLCFRCLASYHQGKDCLRSRECGVNGCKNTHHKLLHGSETKQDNYPSQTSGNDETFQKPSRTFAVIPDSETISASDKDPYEASQESTNITSSASAKVSVKSLSFRTISVWLKANGKKIKVNAVLDDASSASYMNEDVAGVLGLSVPYEPVAVQVVNNKVETFDSMPVKLMLESSDGNVKTPFSAFTCPRQITGKYKVVEWKRHQASWPHLQVCNFPETAFDPVVDVLIGQDYIDLHYSRCDVKGKPGEPIARLGPLG